MSGADQAIETLGEVIQAYKQRIAELEAIVLNQQKIIEEARQPKEPDANPV